MTMNKGSRIKVEPASSHNVTTSSGLKVNLK